MKTSNNLCNSSFNHSSFNQRVVNPSSHSPSPLNRHELLKSSFRSEETNDPIALARKQMSVISRSMLEPQKKMRSFGEKLDYYASRLNQDSKVRQAIHLIVDKYEESINHFLLDGPSQQTKKNMSGNKLDQHEARFAHHKTVWEQIHLKMDKHEKSLNFGHNEGEVEANIGISRRYIPLNRDIEQIPEDISLDTEGTEKIDEKKIKIESMLAIIRVIYLFLSQRIYQSIRPISSSTPFVQEE